MKNFTIEFNSNELVVINKFIKQQQNNLEIDYIGIDKEEAREELRKLYQGILNKIFLAYEENKC